MITRRRHTNNTLHVRVFNTTTHVGSRARACTWVTSIAGRQRRRRRIRKMQTLLRRRSGLGKGVEDGVPISGAGSRRRYLSRRWYLSNILVILLLHGASQSSGPSEHKHDSGTFVQTTELLKFRVKGKRTLIQDRWRPATMHCAQG